MCIYIGELATVWAYPQFYVTDVQLGFGNMSASYQTGWATGVEATAFENVTATISTVQVGRDLPVVSGANLTNLSAGNLTGTLPNATVNGGTYSMNITGNASTATTATNLSGGTVSATTISGTTVNIAGNGASADPYGTIAITEPANANNYSYYGLTRAGSIGAGFGITGTTGALSIGANAFWFGTATAGSAGTMGAPYIAFNSSTFNTSGAVIAAGTVTGSNLSGTNTGDNAANTTYASDYRAANFVAGTNYLAPTGSAAGLTGLTSGQVTTALGFTPYNATNPNSYVTAAVTLTTAAQPNVTSVGTLSTLTVTGAIITEGLNVGWKIIPQISQSAAYTLTLTDSGKHIFHPSADTTARIFTIPANSSVAFPIGTSVTFVNQNAAGTITLSITTDTMRLAGPGTTGDRTLAANGVCTALKVAATEWIVFGTGVT
jgi:hypothetical protein